MRRNRLMLAVAAVAVLLALNAVLVVAQPGLALPRSLWTYLVGPKMVRAEVIVLDRGVLHYYRVDRGRIVAKTPTSLTLRERDGTQVTIAVSPTAEVFQFGRPARLTDLRKGAWATTVRDGDAPAERIEVTPR
jgi:hypothetical protein